MELQQQLRRLQQQVDHLTAGLALLGLDFCAVCGKPHGKGSYDKGEIMAFRRADSDSRLLVCMDDPVKAACFFAMINKTEEQSWGEPTPIRYRDMAGTFARWIIVSGAYDRAHPMNGFVQEAIMGTVGFETEDLAIELMYWRNATFGGVATAGETERDLLSLCGWDPSDDEYEALRQRCLERAKSHSNAGQISHFSQSDPLAKRGIERTWSRPVL